MTAPQQTDGQSGRAGDRQARGEARRADTRGDRRRRCVVACQQLPDRRSDLSAGQSACCARLLRPDHIKPRLLGHWGTSPGLSFIYAHASRLIRLTGQEMLYLTGPGMAARRWSRPAISRARYTEVYPKRHPGCRGPASAVPPVLQSRRHTQPCLGHHTGLDPRRW